MDMHEGKISVHSDGEGHGTKFTVELPVYYRVSILRDSYDSKSDGESLLSSVNDCLLDVNENGFPISSVPADAQRHLSIASSVMSTSDDQTSVCDVECVVGASSDINNKNEGMGEDGLSTSAMSLHRLHSKASLSAMYAKANNQQQPLVSPRRLITPGGKSSKKLNLRVLVVDDAAMNRKMVCRLLASRCEYVAEAEDGLEALDEYSKHKDRNIEFHFVFMDYMMPNMSGPDATKRLRDLGYRGKIIGLTGNTDQSDVDIFMTNGADAVLFKPLDIEALDSVLHSKYCI